MVRHMHSVFSNLIPNLLSTLQPKRPTDCNKEIIYSAINIFILNKILDFA